MQTLNQFFPYDIKETTTQAVKSVSVKSKEAYQKTKEQAAKLGKYIEPAGNQIVRYTSKLTQPATYQGLPLLIRSVEALIKNPTTQKIKVIVEKYAMIIAAIPPIRDLLISTLLKLSGFTSAGVKFGSFASWVQSSFYGGFIAKGSLFAKLQSIGALGIFDPTLITLLLLGGVTFYYFYVYSRSTHKDNVFKWNVKDSLEKGKITVPTDVSFAKGKFDIKWKNLETKHLKAWKQLF